jgi:chemotaxis protein CheD
VANPHCASNIPNKPQLPVRGFAHIDRYWDTRMGCPAAKILPGQYYVTRSEEVIVTVLGSCVSACIRDRIFGIGGMNHFMLPNGSATQSKSWCNELDDDAARYGVYAMELLINDVLKNGGHRQNLEVKITGGGRMLANMSDIGRRNIDFVNKFLTTEGLKVVAEDLGDIYPRKVCYFPNTGRLRVKKLRTMHNGAILQREEVYRQDLHKQVPRGDVEIF